MYICSKTKSRVEVGFKNSLEINQMPKDILLPEKELKAFVPSFVRRGLIMGIDEDISEKEIAEVAIEAEYIKYWVLEDSTKEIEIPISKKMIPNGYSTDR